MITVFGSINMDLIATTDRLPKPGETVAGNGFATAAGGKGLAVPGDLTLPGSAERLITRAAEHFGENRHLGGFFND